MVSHSDSHPEKSKQAGTPSRQFDEKTEWELNDQVFSQLCEIWQQPCVDLFASRLDNKIRKYCAWKPDPLATFIDAFTVN